MRSSSRMAFLALTFAVAAFCGIPGGPARGDALEDRSRAVLDSWLTHIMQSLLVRIEPKVIPIEDDILHKVFLSDRFFGVYLPRWPVAIRTPAELSYESVVAIRLGESVEPIRDENALRAFLSQTLANIADEGRAQAAVLASLRLAAALANGGPYQLDNPDVSVVRQDNHIVATAQAAVCEPGRGAVTIRMEFGEDGKIMPGAIEIDGQPRPGPP